jgi:hypothetical protein
MGMNPEKERHTMEQIRLYLSMIPESLVASMLPPEEFGSYLAVGSHKRSSSPAIYFEVDPGFTSDFFNMGIVKERCVAHADGSPKHSLYLGIYRVLEHIPLAALRKLYLTTRDGQVLALEQSQLPSVSPAEHYLYDEICPIHPLIASKLDPVAFTKFVTDPDSPLCVPKICFADIDPAAIIGTDRTAESMPAIHNLPERIKECFRDLDTAGKPTKTVDRIRPLSFRWNHIKNGYFVGDGETLLYYPFPDRDTLDRKHHQWLRSASL